MATLSLLTDTLSRCHIGAAAIPLSEVEPELLRYRPALLDGAALAEAIAATPARTLCYLTDALGCTYCHFLLEGGERRVLCIGPYLTRRPQKGELARLARRLGLPPQKQRYLREYMMGLAEVEEGGAIDMLIAAFCEQMWQTASFAVRKAGEGHVQGDSPFSRSFEQIGEDEPELNIRAIEQRYEYENELMRAVSLGQAQLEPRFRRAFSFEFFERRAKEPLRNCKNYGVIMNTLLRKAAERGGVHPVQLDRVSSEFAARLEGAETPAACRSLMSEMFRTYCRLVRSGSLDAFSELVRHTVLTVEADLSADLSPRRLASVLGVSLGYLSTLFRRETGTTLTAFVRRRRMEYAAYLLADGDLQVQSVAMHCGIPDVQYFSKVFKAELGKTPSEYRRAARAQG